MTEPVSTEEHLDRIRRVRSVACPKCGAPEGRPCRSSGGASLSIHHAARYARLYRQGARRP